MELEVTNKKTLMFYINSLNSGGAERVILQLAYLFSKHGYRAVLVTSFKGENEYSIPEGVERIVIEKEKITCGKIKKNITRIKALKKFIKEYKPEAVISFMAEPNFRSIIASKGLKVKTIISVRSDPNREYGGKINRFLGKHLLKKADGCVFQTEDAKSWFPKKLQDKSTIITNAVATEFFKTDYIGGQDIVTLGRLEKVKNHQLLIKSFANIKDEFKDVNLRIYGAGENEQALNALIKELGLEDRAFLMGRTKDSAQILKNAKLFVLSSNVEGMPNALMEALAVGVPSISTDCPCGGPKMLIKSGENGILVGVDNEQEMSGAMRKILGDNSFATQLSKNAKESAKKFTPELVFEKWKNYVEQVIKN